MIKINNNNNQIKSDESKISELEENLGKNKNIINEYKKCIEEKESLLKSN